MSKRNLLPFQSNQYQYYDDGLCRILNTQRDNEGSV